MFTRQAAALPQKKRALRGRRQVLVDIENVIGGAALSCDQVLWAKTQLGAVIEIEVDDHIVIGTSHIGLLPTGCAWPNLRYVVGSGPSGADRALLEVLTEDLASRFDEVVVVSGDGIFTEAVAALTRVGVKVTVVAHAEGLSNRLRMAASRVVTLPGRRDTASVALGGAA